MDIESQKYRFLGAKRFSFQALVRMAMLRYYKGKLSFMPAREVNAQLCTLTDDCAICQASWLGLSPGGGALRPAEDTREWETVEDEFALLAVCNLPAQASNMRMAPYAHLADGTMDVCVVRRCPRSVLVDMFRQLDTGEFVNNSKFNQDNHVQYHKVSEMILEPLTPEGCFAADGEPIEYRRLHISMVSNVLIKVPY